MSEGGQAQALADEGPRSGAEGPRRPARAPEAMFERVAVLGIGLVGGSLARDLRRLRLARRTVALDCSAAAARRALELGLVDEATTDPRAAVEGADLVVLAVPVGAMGEVARAVAPALRPDAVVTDVGSVKAPVLGLVAPHLDPRRFVPGHPVAGTENSGPDAALEGLFAGRWCILTPDGRADPDAVERVASMWRAVGSEVERMDAAHHDQVLAVTSHLPHLLAFNLINTAGSIETVLEREVLKYAAGGFTDFTRIAASDPTLWRDVFLANRGAVLEMVSRYIEDLTALQRVIRWGEGDALLERFASAQAIRRGVVLAGQAYERRPAGPSPAPETTPAPSAARAARRA